MLWLTAVEHINFDGLGVGPVCRRLLDQFAVLCSGPPWLASLPHPPVPGHLIIFAMNDDFSFCKIMLESDPNQDLLVSALLK